MNRQLVPIEEQALEGHDFRALLHAERVKGEGHVHGAVRGLRHEGCLGGDRVSARVRQGLLGDVAVLVVALDHERAREGVLLAGDEVRVGDRVHHGGLAVRHHVLVAVHGVGGRGADFRRYDIELLVNVVLVLVLGKEGVGAVRDLIQFLEDRDGLPAQLIGGNLHLHDRITGGGLGNEGAGSAHGCAVHGDGLAGFGIHHSGHELVLAAQREAGVGHLIRDGNVAHHDGAVLVGRVIGIGGDDDLALRLVVQRAVVHGHAVAADGDGGADELIALVVGAAQLLDGIAVIGQRAEGVVRTDHGALGGETEPCARHRVELGAVDFLVGSRVHRPVVPVGVGGMGVPRGGGAEIAVFVGDDYMALAGGEGGHLEGHEREAVAVVVGLLVELKVAALHLIVDVAVVLAVIQRVHDDPILTDGELVGRPVGEVVALADLDLLQRVGAEGQVVSVSDRIAVLDDKVLADDISLVVGDTIYDDRLVTHEANLELGAVEGRAAQRCPEVALDVALVDLYAAAHHVIGGGEVIDRAVLGDGGVNVISGVEIAVVGRGLRMM